MPPQDYLPLLELAQRDLIRRPRLQCVQVAKKEVILLLHPVPVAQIVLLELMLRRLQRAAAQTVLWEIISHQQAPQLVRHVPEGRIVPPRL